MDPALLKQREAFLKRATVTPTVFKKASANEKRGNDDTGSTKEKSAKKSKHAHASDIGNKTTPKFDYKTAKASMVASFGVLAKIVDHMKKRHLEQSQWSLGLDEILEELQLLDLPNKTKAWLKEVLPQNPRMTTDVEGKFLYKPPYNIRGKKSLIQVLKRHDLEGKGGILMSELAECIPNAEKTVLAMGDQIMVIGTNVNKRKDKVLFYNDPESAVIVDEEYKALWRGVGVDHLDEKKIEEYLHKHGIDSMKDLAPKKIGSAGQAPKRKNAGKRKTIVHNEHLDGVLMDFGGDT